MSLPKTTSPKWLFLRFSAIGDCVMAAWVVTAVRNKFPDATIGWGVENWCAPVIESGSLVNFKFEFGSKPKRGRGGSRSAWQDFTKALSMRKHRFDYGIDLHGHAKTAICLRLSGAKTRLAIDATDFASKSLNPTLKRPDRDLHCVDWQFQALQPIVELEIPPRPIMPAAPNLNFPPGLVSISTGAGQKNKEWPIDRWQAVAESLVEAGYEVAFLGKNSDEPKLGPGITSYINKLSLLEAIEAVRRSRLHLSADTGNAHMSAAVGTPFVTVFGPTNPSRFRPYSPNGKVLRNTRETTSVSVSEVLIASHELLGEESK